MLLGKERLFNYINKFGFGEKTGIDLNGEGTGIMFSLPQVGNVELATSAFGQGPSVTPLQQVIAVSAIVNGGYLYKPYVVKSINEPVTNTVIVSNKSTFVSEVSNFTESLLECYLFCIIANSPQASRSPDSR